MALLSVLSRRIRSVCLLGALLAPQSAATWSIVAVDPATGEVVVASATCVGGIPLHHAVPIIVVGRGGAASQALGANATIKTFIYDGFLAGKSPIAILGDLDLNDSGFQSRQFGIADFSHEPISFSGAQAMESKPNVTGVAGTAFYAIQGNILTGTPVVTLAEQALIETPGDLGQRVMAAMEAARSMGGDGRCSCPGQPTSCGAPPDEFEKSAHVGFVYIARMGDTDGGCSEPFGCAQGDYYMELTFQGSPSDVDPVFELQDQYDAWRAEKVGRPDHLKSRVTLGAPKLVADGVTSTTVTVSLADIDGSPIESGGALLNVGPVEGAAPGMFETGPVQDGGDGTYQFEVTAGETPGDVELAIRVDDGLGEVLLYPYPTLTLDAPAALSLGYSQVSASTGAAVPFVVHGGESAAGAAYWVLASAHGTRPGVLVDGVQVPLNQDALLELTLKDPGGRMLPGSSGVLDAAGRGAGQALVPMAAMRSWIGLRIHFASLIRNPLDTGWMVSEPQRLTLVP